MESIDDIKNTAEWGLTVLDAKNLLDMKTLQVGLTQRLADGYIDIDTWVTLDGKYEGVIQMLKDRLALHGKEESLANARGIATLNSGISEAIVAIDKLKGMSSKHQNIAKLIEGRIGIKATLAVPKLD